MATEIRCPECARLLAKLDDDGTFIIRYRDRYSIEMKVGNITCLKCNETIVIGTITSRSTGTWGPRP